MVKKLFKQELISYSRNLMPMFYILIGISVLNRIVQFFEADTFSYNVVFISSLIALIVSVVVCLIMSVVVAIKRYYTNFFTGEGYLTFTLPVTHHQLIITKLLCAILMFFASVASCLIAGAVATSGEVFNEVLKAVAYLFKDYFKVTDGHGIFYIIELIVFAISTIASSFLLFYGCITIGQLAKKNRVAAAFGAYFVYYLIEQFLGTIFIIVIPHIYPKLPLEAIEEFTVAHPFATLHIIIIGLTVYVLALSCLYYYITQRITKRKLNLE